MPRPTCASALWPARSSKPWPAIPTGTLPMRRRGGIISGGSASPTWRSIPTRSASPPKARCGGRSRGCCPTPCPTTVRARGLVLGPCRAPSSTTFTDQQYAAQQRLRALVWWFYADLKAYRRDPRRRAALRARFDRIFRRRTGFATLDRLLDRLSANKDELLRVLDHPEVPLHTNGSERDLRPQLIKRKISGGTRSDQGRDCRDAFLGLLLTCAKLGVSFWDFLGHRLGVAQADAPYLPDLVRLRSAPPECPDFCPRYIDRPKVYNNTAVSFFHSGSPRGGLKLVCRRQSLHFHFAGAALRVGTP